MTAIATDTIGGLPLEVYLEGYTSGLANVLAGPVVITHGRSRADERIEAATCSLTLRASLLPQLPEVGGFLWVLASEDALDWAGIPSPATTAGQEAVWRFNGNITDVSTTPGVGEEPLVSVVATASLSRIAGLSIPVSEAPWPAELDGARAARLLAYLDDYKQSVEALLAAFSHPGPARLEFFIGTADAGVYTVRARDWDGGADSQVPAQFDALQTSTGGSLVQRRNSLLDWHDADHSSSAAVSLQLTASQVLSDLTATQSRAGLANFVTVTYGDPASALFVAALDPDSVADHGIIGITVTTDIDTQTEAQAFADALVAQRKQPKWRLSTLHVDLVRYDPATGAGITPAVAGDLLRLEHGDVLEVTGMPAAGPFSSRRLVVEGWTETVGRHEWSLDLAVSDEGVIA